MVYSFETGQEVVLRGGSRLSANVRGGDQGTAGAGTGAGAAAAVVAASASPDNKTLAVACAGSGENCRYHRFWFVLGTNVACNLSVQAVIFFCARGMYQGSIPGMQYASMPVQDKLRYHTIVAWVFLRSVCACSGITTVEKNKNKNGGLTAWARQKKPT